MAGFIDAVPMMNGLAERSPGYLWRHSDEEAAHAELFADDPRMTLTLSLWRDLESLRFFTWQTLHKRFRQRTAEWFEPLGARYLVVWDVPEGHLPTPREAMNALNALRAEGPSPERRGTEALRPEGPGDAPISGARNGSAIRHHETTHRNAPQ